jgi:hypothetical protein
LASITAPFFLAYGLTIGSSLVAVVFIAKRLVLKLDGEKFRLLMDRLLLVEGATMLWAAVR